MKTGSNSNEKRKEAKRAETHPNREPNSRNNFKSIFSIWFWNESNQQTNSNSWEENQFVSIVIIFLRHIIYAVLFVFSFLVLFLRQYV